MIKLINNIIKMIQNKQEIHLFTLTHYKETLAKQTKTIWTHDLFVIIIRENQQTKSKN